MYVREIIDALRSMRVETGSLVCVGCKHVNQCGVHGCAIMRAAADKLAQTTSALNQALVERNNFRGAYLEIADMLATLHRGELPPIPEECPSDAIVAEIRERRSCENCGDERCRSSAIAYHWDECVESKFQKNWKPRG